MPKEFYTEKDIEDLFKGGVMSLEVTDNVVLTELAYEKAGRLGMQLHRSQPDNPPSAPVRPYLSQKQAPRPASPAPASERLPERKCRPPDGCPWGGSRPAAAHPHGRHRPPGHDR